MNSVAATRYAPLTTPSGTRYFFRDRNIESMRCVTRNPPTTFTVARISAATPRAAASVVCCAPAAMIAPTMETPEIALAPRHERRVEGRRDLGDDFEPDERGEQEHREGEDEDFHLRSRHRGRVRG